MTIPNKKQPSVRDKAATRAKNNTTPSSPQKTNRGDDPRVQSVRKDPSTNLDSWKARLSNREAVLQGVGGWAQGTKTARVATSEDIDRYVNSVANPSTTPPMNAKKHRHTPHKSWEPYTPSMSK